MPRALRIQYPGAIYHVMNRGDRREPIFRGTWTHDPIPILPPSGVLQVAAYETINVEVQQRNSP